VYVRTRGAESCPDERELRDAVAARVGYDPFFWWAKQTVVATMSLEPSGGFAASVMLVDEQGMGRGMRTLTTTGACPEIVDAAALAIAIAIDPRSLDPRAPSPSSDESPAPEPVLVPVPKPPPSRVEATQPAPSPRRALVFEGSLGAVAVSGGSPAPALGAFVGLAARLGQASVGVEGRFDGASGAPAQGGGRISVKLWNASLLQSAR
jgi:hypothetical protein